MAVAEQLKVNDPKIKLIYLGEKGGKFKDLIESSDVFDHKYYIYSGKFRRYHNQSLVARLLDIKTIILNIRDLVKISFGIFQGVILFRKLKADRVFLKGGSVCIPAGLGARFAKITTITHDSDALPGVSNRIGGKHAKYHATAMPAKYYKYPEGKIVHVGLPISEKFKPYPKDKVLDIKNSFNIPKKGEVLLITGGSNGARRLNMWCLEVLPDILEKKSDLYVIIVTGKGNMDILDAIPKANRDRIIFIEFTSKMFDLVAIADLVITRAGATTIAEFASAKKPIIIVPNPDLSGGHQLKNAKVYQDSGSLEVVNESELKKNVKILAELTINLLNDKDRREGLSSKLYNTLPNEPAAQKLANLILDS